MKKLLSALTSLALLASVATMPVSAEEVYAPLPAQLGKSYLVEDVDFLVDSIVAKDQEAPSYFLQSNTPKGIYISQYCPGGCLMDYTSITRPYPVHGTYIVENSGCEIDIYMQDAAMISEDAELIALLGENYTISKTCLTTSSLTNSRTYCTSICIKEAPEEAKEIADAVYAWVIADHVVEAFTFSEAIICSNQIGFGGPLYRLRDYPNAEEELTAFVADYSDDWRLLVKGSYYQLVPNKDDVDHFYLMDMVKRVYDALGYIPYYEMLEEGPSETAINTVYYAPNLGDVNADGKVTVSDAILLSRYAAENSTVSITAAGMAVADLNNDGEVNADDTTALLMMLAGLAQ